MADIVQQKAGRVCVEKKGPIVPKFTDWLYRNTLVFKLVLVVAAIVEAVVVFRIWISVPN